MTRKRFYGNTMMQYVMTLAKYIFPLITLPYLTRVLDTDVYGVIVYMIATTSFVQLFLDYGFNLSATKDVALHQGSSNQLSRIIGSVLQAKSALSVIACMMYGFAVITVPILKEHMLIAWLYFIPSLLTIFLMDFLFRGLERMGVITNRFLASKSISTICILLFVQGNTDIIWIPIFEVLGTVVAILWTWKYITKHLKLNIEWGTLQDIGNVLRHSSIYFASTFATTAFGLINTLMLGWMNVPLTEVAYWSVSYTLIGAAQAMYTPITNSLYPHMVIRKDHGLVNKILFIFMPLIGLVIVGLWFSSSHILVLFAGAEYANATITFRWLLPVLFLSFPAMIIGFPVLGALGKVKETTRTTVISAIFHIVGLLLLAVGGWFSIVNIAILRSCTEMILLTTRVITLRYIMKNA